MSKVNIAVAVDGSEASKRATAWAATILQGSDNLHIVTVCDAKSGIVPDHKVESAAHLLRSHAEIAQDAGVPKSKIVEHLLSGRTDGVQPGATIVQFASPDTFKLLVVGSRGMGAVQAAIMSFVGLGSISSYILEHAKVPTAIVRLGTHPKPKGVNELRRICVGMDGSQHASHALAWALTHLVHAERDILHLVSVSHRNSEVSTVMHTAAPLGYERQMSMRRAAADSASAIVHAAGLQALLAGIPSEHIVCAALDPHSSGSSNEGGALVKYTDALQMDILVMGHRGQGSTAMSVLSGIGSVTNECVQTAQCPVIATRVGS